MIQIMSRVDAAQFIAVNPDHPIIAIGEPQDNDVDDKITRHANNCLCLKFHDIEFERPGYETVTDEQISHAIDWAKDKDDLIVACRVGRSRSSAMAYIIACSKEKPEDAILVLDMFLHQPNRLIIVK